MNLARVLIAVVLGAVGAYYLARDARRVWANRSARDTLSRLERARVLAIGLAFAGILPVLPAIALGLGWLVLVCIGLTVLGAVGFVVLSVVVGFLEGSRGKGRLE